MEIGSWVPQVFYDLIGRVVPGAFLLFMCLFLFLDAASAHDLVLFLFKDPGIPLTAVVLIGLTVSYVTATLLGAVGFAVWHREWSTKGLADLRVEYPVEGKPGLGIALMYDAILLREPAAGARLVKLRAEQHMCRVLIVGTVAILLVYVFGSWPPWQSWRHLGTMIGLVGGGAAAHLFDVHLTLRSRLLLMNYWHLLEMPMPRKIQGSPKEA